MGDCNSSRYLFIAIYRYIHILMMLLVMNWIYIYLIYLSPWMFISIFYGAAGGRFESVFPIFKDSLCCEYCTNAMFQCCCRGIVNGLHRSGNLQRCQRWNLTVGVQQRLMNRPISQIPHCIRQISPDAHVVTEMCTFVHIFVAKCCIVGYSTDALCD